LVSILVLPIFAVMIVYMAWPDLVVC